MLKEGKSPPDAMQQKIRDHKKKWNPIVSAFINDLIHFKKLMNGSPNKFYMQKGDIKYSIPADPATIIGSLANDFNIIAQEANSIITEQAAYSNNRRKRQSKNMQQTNLPFNQQAPKPEASSQEPVPQQPDLSKQLELPHVASTDFDLIKVAIHFENKYSLTTEASNPLTRFITRLMNPTIGFSEAARIRQIRMELLKACAKTYKGLTKLQVEVVKQNKNSINTAYSMMHNVWNDWKTVRSGFAAYKLRMPDAPPDSGGPIKTPENIKKEKAKENAAVEKAMNQIDVAEDEGKPTPDDPDYDKEVNAPSEKSSENKEKKEEPSWINTKQKVMEESARAEAYQVAKRMKKDFDFTANKMRVLLRNNVDVDVFLKAYPIMSSLVTRKENAAQAVIAEHRQLLSILNDQCSTNATTLSEIPAILVQREKYQSALDKAQEGYALDIAKQREMEAAKQKRPVKQVKPQPRIVKQDPPVPSLPLAPAVPVIPEGPPTPPAVEGAPTPRTAMSASEHLEVTAQAFLKKWVGKTMHQLSPFDSTSSQRIQIFEIAEQMRDQVDQIMDHLEKDIDVKEMDEMVGETNKYMENIRQQMLNLHKLHAPKAKK